MQYKDIYKLSLANNNFRQVLFTNTHSQVVLMSLLPGEEIGMETHAAADQVLFFTHGVGKTVVAGEERELRAGDLVDVPAGTAHNFTNTGQEPLKLFTVYAPPQHKDGTVHATKAEADAAE
jgi:mannose-6-phosphate isomerase-like protein (cupin superfamily)